MLAALGAVAFWGLTFVPAKLALAEMGSFTLAALRFSVALAIMLGVVSRIQPNLHHLRRPPLGTMALLGFTGIALCHGLQNLGLARTSASDAALVFGSVPAITAALSALLLHERVSPLRVVGIAASMVGLAVVVLAGGENAQVGSVLGDLLVLGGAVAWAFYTIIYKGIGGKMPESLLLAWTMAFGTLFLFPAAGAETAAAGLGPISPVGLLSVLYLGIGGSAAAFFCWNAALRHLDASEASTYLNLVPVVAVAFAALLLGERLAPAQMLGGALVILGVFLAGRQG